MQGQEDQRKAAVNKPVGGHELPVDGPALLEDAGELKGPPQVGTRGHGEERSCQQGLEQETRRQSPQHGEGRGLADQHRKNAGGPEQDIHLDADCRTVHEDGQGPPTRLYLGEREEKGVGGGVLEGASV